MSDTDNLCARLQNSIDRARGSRPTAPDLTAAKAEPDGLPYVVALRMDDGSAGGLWSTESFATVEAAEEAARNAGRDRAVYRLAPVSSPPAVELPVTLSSVDDVAAVCLAHGLTPAEHIPGHAWVGGGARVTWSEERRTADVGRSDRPNGGSVSVPWGWPTRVLVTAIEAARGGSR